MVVFTLNTNPSFTGFALLHAGLSFAEKTDIIHKNS